MGRGRVERILVHSTISTPEFEMSIAIPDRWDSEEYIDRLFERLFGDDLRYSLDYEFC